MNKILIFFATSISIIKTHDEVKNCNSFYESQNFQNIATQGKIINSIEKDDRYEIILDNNAKLKVYKNLPGEEVFELAKKGAYIKKIKGNMSFSIAWINEEKKVIVRDFTELCD